MVAGERGDPLAGSRAVRELAIDAGADFGVEVAVSSWTIYVDHVTVI